MARYNKTWTYIKYTSINKCQHTACICCVIYCYIFTITKKSILYLQRVTLLTGLSLGSMKNILMIISNSPHPVSVISYGGLVTTKRKKKENNSEF